VLLGRELVVVVEAIDEEKPGKLDVMESEKLKINILFYIINKNELNGLTQKCTRVENPGERVAKIPGGVKV
jgi:hypothetical protein